MKRQTFTARSLVSVSLVAVACTGSGTIAPVPTVGVGRCTFTNPIAAGADPWVVRHAGMYYYAKSSDNKIWIAKSPRLSDVVTAPAVVVWTAPDTGWNRAHLWAPELQHVDGRWYLYYAAGRTGPPYTSQQAGVLESAGDDPQGKYLDRGMLYTGDSIGTGSGNRWAIDLTIGTMGTRRYAVWSGWKQRAATDKTPQQLYIAPMSNPWTISANRVMLSEPVEAWERGPELDLLEGPQLLQRGMQTFLIYSTRDSWLKEYSLGQLQLRDAGANPMRPDSWTKTGPVFVGHSTVFGVGHASFTTSADGTENWIVYHSKNSPVPGWSRNVRMQPFDWPSNGEPRFGEALSNDAHVPLPRGECQ